MMWFGAALLAWAIAFSIHRICQTVAQDNAAKVSIAAATERVAAHHAARAEADARRIEAQVALSCNVRENADKLEAELATLRANLLPKNEAPPVRTHFGRHLHIVPGDKPTPDPAA